MGDFSCSSNPLKYNCRRTRRRKRSQSTCGLIKSDCNVVVADNAKGAKRRRACHTRWLNVRIARNRLVANGNRGRMTTDSMDRKACCQ